MSGIREVQDLMANKELGNMAVCMEEYAWKGLDTFDMWRRSWRRLPADRSSHSGLCEQRLPADRLEH